MANTRITMRKLKELLRLHFEAGLPNRAIARSLNLARSTVQCHLDRFAASGLSWPLKDPLDDEALEHKLFPVTGAAKSDDDVPDWGNVHQELKRKGVTLNRLWIEFKLDHPDSLQYSQFCAQYRQFAKLLNVSMRQHHKAGEKLFIDYSGSTMPVIDPTTGEVRQAQIFLAVMGASSYTFAEATWSQTLPDWIGSHVRAFEFFGGVTELLVPDNLRSGVTKAHRYDPDVNITYFTMASHYGTAVMPARARKPKDKPKAEGGVLLAQRWILAALRNQTFFSLEELNAAIRPLLTQLNQHPFKKLPGSRETAFKSLEQPTLKPLPTLPHELDEWRKARVPLDYHVVCELHHYSVPFTLIGEKVEIRMTERVIEVLHKGSRVASHLRSHVAGGTSTHKEHMPLPHQYYAKWTPEAIMAWAEKVGYETQCLFLATLEDRPHPYIAHKACLGVVHLEKEYALERIEAACRRANMCGITRVESIKSILVHGLDRLPMAPKAEPAPIQHENIRGEAFYATKGLLALPL